MVTHRKADGVEEERRLLCGALTRARRAVAVTYALSRFARGQQPSPFLAEIATAMAAPRVPLGFRWTGAGAPTKGRSPGTFAPASQSSTSGMTATASIGRGGLRTYRRGGGRKIGRAHV